MMQAKLGPKDFLPKPFHSPLVILRNAMVAAAISGTLGTGAADAQTAREDWLTTWAASPQPVWEADFFAPVGIPRSLMNQTIRQVARVSVGGKQVRIEISNEYGRQPIVIG